MHESYTTHAADGRLVSCVGKDAISLYRASTLAVGLQMYAKTGIKLTRVASPGAMLKMATEYTGKTYKRGEYLKAAEDVRIWTATMRAALPAITQGEKE